MCNKNKSQNFIIWIGIALSLFIFFLFVDETATTTNDAELAAHRYCYMVFNGQWPDYQNNYGQFCVAERWNGK